MKFTKKTDNARHGWKAKCEIRQHVLAAIGAERAHVFDAFAGAGLLWDAVWRDAASYVGCDERWFPDGARCAFVADNRRVLRCVDLAAFNCFDLDAYGSPWEQALIIAARRPLAGGERIGLVITEGSSLKTRFSALPYAMMQAAGLTRVAERGAGKMHDEIIGRAIRGVVRRMGGSVVREWLAVAENSTGMRYIGLVVEGERQNRNRGAAGASETAGNGAGKPPESPGDARGVAGAGRGEAGPELPGEGQETGPEQTPGPGRGKRRRSGRHR